MKKKSKLETTKGALFLSLILFLFSGYFFFSTNEESEVIIAQVKKEIPKTDLRVKKPKLESKKSPHKGMVSSVPKEGFIYHEGLYYDKDVLEQEECFKFWRENPNERQINIRTDFQEKWGYFVYSSMTKDKKKRVEGFSGSKEESLFLGYSMSGIERKKFKKPDEVTTNMAFKHLKKAAALDPKNSAPLVFLWLFQRKLGQLKEAKATYKKFQSTEYFDNYVGNLEIEMLETVEDFEGLVEYSNLLESQKLLWPSTMIKELVKVGDKKIAHQLTDPAFKLGAKMVRDFDHLGYAYGRRILLNLGTGKHLPSSNEIFRKFNRTAYEPIEYEFNKNCEMTNFQKVVKDIKKSRL